MVNQGGKFPPGSLRGSKRRDSAPLFAPRNAVGVDILVQITDSKQPSSTNQNRRYFASTDHPVNRGQRDSQVIRGLLISHQAACATDRSMGMDRTYQGLAQLVAPTEEKTPIGAAANTPA